LNCGEVRLQWQASTDAGGSSVRGYRIFRNGNFVTEVAVAITSFTDSGLSPAAKYDYVISATDTSGNESLPCPSTPAVTTVCDDLTPPTAPSGLTASAISCESVSLNWNSSLDTGGSGVRGYRILRNGSLVTEVPAGITSFLDSGLSAERTYSYRVSAKDRSNNESDQSNEAVVATLPCDDTTAPTAPASLTAIVISCDEIKLSWSGSTDNGGSGVRGYRIVRNGVLVTEVPSTVTIFVDSGLSPLHAYRYVVTAKDRSNNESSDSNTASATTPSCDSTNAPSVPVGVTATASVCGQIDLKWNPSQDLSGAGVRGYKIYRNGTLVTEVSASSTSFSDVGVSTLGKYAYAISAVDKTQNESRRSDSVNVTAPPCGNAFKGDFNQDLKTDIVLQNTDGTVAFWTMSGTTIAGASAPYVIPAGWQIVGAGDFNHNAATDLVLQNTDHSVAFWMMNGTSITEGIFGTPLPEGSRIAATGDFNHDGQSDIVVQNSDGSVAFWLMDGVSVTSTEAPYNPTSAWRVAGTGRFNHGTATDIVLQHDDGTVAFWLMDGTTILSGVAPYQIPSAWKIVATGNFNEDDNTDIVLQHDDGTVAFWLMDGTTILSGVAPYTVPPAWRIAGPR
jgi:chitodextrinase